MSKQFNTLCLVLVSLLFTSCFSSKEEVWISPDGSGRMETESDMSSLYPFISMGMAAEKEKIANGEESSDDNPFTDLMMAEELDTTFHMKDFMVEAMEEQGMSWEQMLDSIRHAPTPKDKEPLSPSQREAMVDMFEDMMDLKMRWQVSQKNQIMKSTQIQEFVQVNDLEEKSGGMMEMMKKLGELGGDQGDQEDEDMIGMFDKLSGAVTSLKLNGNTLNISRSGMDLSALGEEMEQTMGMMKMMLGGEHYKIVVHFPGKVKKVSSDMAKIGSDKKSIAIEFPLDQLFDPEMNIDVDVLFKGLKN